MNTLHAFDAEAPEALREAYELLTLMIAPMMPHLAEEAWALLGHETMVVHAAWPSAEPDLVAQDTVTLAVQVNGKRRDEITLKDLPAPDVEAAVLALDSIVRALDGGAPEGDRRAEPHRQSGDLMGARIAFVVVAALALSACGFRPLYGTASLPEGAETVFGSIRVAPIGPTNDSDRIGYLLYDALDRALHTPGHNETPRFELKLTLADERRGLPFRTIARPRATITVCRPTGL